MHTIVRLAGTPARGAALLVAMSACTLLSDFDVPLGTTPGAEGGAGADASVPAGAIVFETFDDERPACGFDIEEGAAVPDVEARTGARACRICANAAGQKIRVGRRLTPRAGRYVASIWLRRPAGSPRPTAWEVRFLADRPDASGVTEKGSGQSEESWQLAQATITLAQQPSSLRLRLGSEQDLSAGDCLLVDDLDVSYEP